MIPDSEPLEIDGSLDLLIRYIYDRIPTFIHKSKLFSEVFNNDPRIPIDALLAQLEDEDFIHHPLQLIDNLEVERIDHYSLKTSGIFFYQRSSVSQRPFYARELARIEALEKAEVMAKVIRQDSFLKRNWMLLPFITFLLGMIATLGTEFLKHRIWPDPSSKTQFVIVHDTIRVTQRVSK